MNPGIGLMPKGPGIGSGSPKATNTGAKYTQPRMKALKRLLTKPSGGGATGGGGQMPIRNGMGG